MFFLTPPPNITGEMHMGLFLICLYTGIYKRINSSKIIKGVDHAGISAEIVADKFFNGDKEKMYNTYGPSLKNDINNVIGEQNNEFYYTLDDQFKELVEEVFSILKTKKVIKITNKIVNYDSSINSIISDFETSTVKKPVTSFTVKYEGLDCEDIYVKTTRPETIEFDEFIVTNSIEHHNCTCLNPLNGNELKIIYCDPETFHFKEDGVQFVKITSTMSSIDHKLKQKIFLGKRFPNDRLNIKDFQRIFSKEYKEKILQELENKEKIISFKTYQTDVPVNKATKSEVFNILIKTPVIDFPKECRNMAKKCVENCKIEPKRYKQEILNYIDEYGLWDILRNREWGHKIVIDDSPDLRIEGVLDTWFSSSLCSLYVYKQFGLNSLPLGLVTGFDIIGTWVARMFLMHCTYKYYTDLKDIPLKDFTPFKKIFFIPIVKGSDGQKMSKSKGNVILYKDLRKKYNELTLAFFGLSLYTRDNFTQFCHLKLNYAEKMYLKFENILNWTTFGSFNMELEVYIQRAIKLRIIFVNADDITKLKNDVYGFIIETSKLIVKNLLTRKQHDNIKKIYLYIKYILTGKKKI